MMKKIFSKRSGFTLVEIVVAFAVFAIMAAMILQILNIVMYEKQSNADFANQMETQEMLIVRNGRNDEYVEGGEGGTLTFAFEGKDEYSIGFQTKYAKGNVENEDGDVEYKEYNDGLAFYVGPGSGSSSDDPLPGESFGGTASAGAQMSRMDTRITGTAGFSEINFYQVVKDESYTGPGVRYFFEVSANGSDMVNEMVPYAQYKLYFYMKDQYDDVKSNVTYTDSNGDSFTRKVPKEAKIIDGGYVNDTKLEWNDSTCIPFSDYLNTGGYNKYAVKIMNSNCIRVGSPYVTNNSDGAEIGGGLRGIRFKSSSFTRFYVVFEEDPQLTRESFGADIKNQGNVTVTDSKVSYSPVPILNDDGTVSDKNYVNIYGAFEYETKAAT
ncbi:MAG: type II secretion system protein J [Oscillospiraceae bacterium]